MVMISWLRLNNVGDTQIKARGEIARLAQHPVGDAVTQLRCNCSVGVRRSMLMVIRPAHTPPERRTFAISFVISTVVGAYTVYLPLPWINAVP